MRETWLVDPEARTIHVHALPEPMASGSGEGARGRSRLGVEGAARYTRAQVYGAGETARSVAFEGLAVEVDGVLGDG